MPRCAKGKWIGVGVQGKTKTAYCRAARYKKERRKKGNGWQKGRTREPQKEDALTGKVKRNRVGRENRASGREKRLGRDARPWLRATDMGVAQRPRLGRGKKQEASLPGGEECAWSGKLVCLFPGTSGNATGE